MSFDASACTQDVVEELALRSWRRLQAAAVCYVGFGIILVLAFLCVRLILQGISTTSRAGQPLDTPRVIILKFKVPIIVRVRSLISLAFVMYMTSFTCLALVSTSITMRNIYVDNGCWNGLTVDNFRSAVDPMLYHAFVFAAWGAEGMMIWRCWVIYRCSSSIPVQIFVIAPLLMFGSVLAMGIVLMNPTLTTHAVNQTHGFIFSVLVMSCTILTTGMVVARLLVYRLRMTRIMGRSMGAPYASYMSILIESASLDFLASLFLLIGMQVKADFQPIALVLKTLTQVISSLLITMRVLEGKAWAQDADDAVTVGSMRTGGTDSDHNHNTSSLVRARPSHRGARTTTLSVIRFTAPFPSATQEHPDDIDDDSRHSIPMTRVDLDKSSGTGREETKEPSMR